MTRVFSPGDFLRPIWPTWRGNPGALSTLLEMTLASLKSSYIDVCGPLPDPHVRSCLVQATAAMVRDAGDAAEVFNCTVLSCALVFLYYEITRRQPRLPTSRMAVPGCSAFGKAMASGRVDAYTHGEQWSDC